MYKNSRVKSDNDLISVSLKGNPSYDIFKSFAAFIIFMHRTTLLNPQNLLNPST